MKRNTWVVAVVGALALANSGWADFKSDVRDAGARLRPAMAEANALLTEGKLDEANAKIMAVFPEKSRTAAEAFVLGNVLFSQDAKVSYPLHKRAVTEAPEVAETHLEWAMEQHRAREYAGAAESYAKYVKEHPDFAPVLGLMAECLIRTGKTREAVDAWKKSEAAGKGTLEEFESLVCEVNGQLFPHRDRTTLLVKVRKGDIEAAEKLIVLDTDFPRDWWNSEVAVTYLEKDLAVLATAKFEDEKRLREIMCAGECALAADSEKKIDGILKKAGLLLDDQSTLPGSGLLVKSMLYFALSTKTIARAEARTKLGDKILAQAAASKDAEMFNAAANLYLGTQRLPQIDKQGWELTGDERFLTSLLVGRAASEELKLEDADLQKASKSFPENGVVARLMLDTTVRSGKPQADALIAAIRAEYTKFSPTGPNMRIGAIPLRVYFGELAKELPKE